MEPEVKPSHINGRRKSRTNRRRQSSNMWDDFVVSEERLHAERDLLVHERQTQVESVLDRHDTLLRESFHLQKFVSLLTFDPKVAKLEDSPVFQQFKESHDLLAQAPSSAESARKTRRAHTERLQLLKGEQSVLAPRSDVRTGRRSSAPRPVNADIWDILTSVKGKGKGEGKQVSPEDASDVVKPLLSPVRRTAPTVESSSAFVTRADSCDSNGSTSPRALMRSSGKSPPADASLTRSRKRRSTESVVTPGNVRSVRSRAPDIRGSFAIPSQKTRVLPPRGATALTYQQLASASTGMTIRRVKLLVRPPPPSFSSPRQRLPAPRHGGSLAVFLASYTTIGHDELIDECNLEKEARKEAQVLERVAALTKQGLFFRAPASLTGLLGSSASGRNVPHPDAWDHVIEAVIAHPSLKKPEHCVPAQVAAKIKGYWGSFAAREDRARAIEEKRLRALAKSTVKSVISEWKKAVFHTREQERLLAEAEELRKGHEHLDAILDQSGIILETQQVGLFKHSFLSSRSRSSSVSTISRDWTPNERDGSLGNDGDADVDENGHNSESEIEGEVARGEDTSALLIGMDANALHNHPERELSSTGGLRLPPASDILGGSFNGSALAADDELVDDYAISSPAASISPDPNDRSASEAQDSRTTVSSLLDRGHADIDEPRSSPYPSVVPDSCNDSAPTSTDIEDAGDGPVPPTFDEGVDAYTRPESPLLAPSPDEGGSPVATLPGIVDLAPREANILSGNASLPHHADDGQLGDLCEIPADFRRRSEAENEAAAEIDNDGVPDSDDSRELRNLVLGQQPTDIMMADGSASDTVPVGSPRPSDVAEDVQEELQEPAVEGSSLFPEHLRPYATTVVEWDPQAKIIPPLLLRGVLRPYQQAGLEWLASLHANNLNGLLADEMGLGKTIQTIALLAHLACDRGIWGPHLIVVPTSVLLNWEMEFKKFLPGFKILRYHGTTKRRKELRQGWNDKHHFNVCITSYALASRDAHILKRKAWYYFILDEAHMIRNFKSQRWNILLMFRSFRRLLLTGTPLHNNLTELWALLQFLMSGTNFANLKEFGEWFANPLEKAIEMGTMLEDENLQRVSKLHTVLRPYLLRRLKADVEKELPSKYEHLVLCPLSRRQRFLYDEFMSRAATRDALQSGNYQKIANILMQLRKVCNHPDLFEVRPIVTSFAMQRSVIATFSLTESLTRRLFATKPALNSDLHDLRFIERQNTSLVASLERRRLDASSLPPSFADASGSCAWDVRTITGFRAYFAHQTRLKTIARWSHFASINRHRCNQSPIYSHEIISIVSQFSAPLSPLSTLERGNPFVNTLVPLIVTSFAKRAQQLGSIIDKFTFVTPTVVALDLPRITFSGVEDLVHRAASDPSFDEVLRPVIIKRQIAFPEPSLLQYDCGKLQKLATLLREKKAGGHRVLIFTQMTRILDILEIFLDSHGYLYLRLDGATKIEDRQYITERFNVDVRVFCFIASSRSGGVGINLTGADTVIFYDSDFNPQMDKQCEDRAHRIGQIRDVHIYRFISKHSVEEAMLRKANQKRFLDDLVIQKGEFDWRSLFWDEGELTKAMEEFEDREDAHAAAVAAQEEVVMDNVDEADFEDVDADAAPNAGPGEEDGGPTEGQDKEFDQAEVEHHPQVEYEEKEEPGTTVDYMLAFVHFDQEHFRSWRL